MSIGALPRTPGAVTDGTGVAFKGEGVGDGATNVPVARVREASELGLEATATPMPISSATTGIATNSIHRIEIGGFIAGES
jgi:hypothetical protein